MFAQSGKRFELNSISFEGNHAFSSSVLSETIFSQPTPWWFWKFLHSFSSLGKEPVYFDSLNIQIDLNSLRNYYASNGFFKAEITYKYNIDTASEKADLIYIIQENKPSEFGKVDLVGMNGYPSLIYTISYDEAKVDTSKRFSQKTIQDNTSKIVSNLQNSGYMFARSDSTIVIKDTAQSKADSYIYILPGECYNVDTVLINKTGEGASLVDDKLLRDITGIKVGEFYSSDELRSSQARLYRTGLFSSVLLAGDVKDTTDHKVPILLTGSIGLMNELSPEVILNNQNRAFNAGLGFSYIRKNFLGDARKLTASTSFGVQDLFRIDYGTLIKRFNFQDTTLLGYVDARIVVDQPYLFGKPIFGTWETYTTINKQTDYNNTVYGSKVTFDFEMPTYTFVNNLSASYTLEQSYTKFRTHNDYLSHTFISDIAVDASSTTADNILFPTQGYNLTFHIEEANSLPYLFSGLFKIDSLALFHKIVLSGSYYVALDRNKNSIAAAKFKIGNIQIFHGNFAGVPINRSFYAGGSNSVRGWRPNDLVPIGSESVLEINGASVKGGTFLMEGSFELRRRFLENVGFALFADYGNTWLGYNQFRWDGIAVATGVGFRYYTPVAPFRIDLGFKFYDPNPGNSKAPSFLWQNWDPHFFNNIVLHFGLGEAF
ncbi:MAG: BamA/TamA family outer membrane protein [Ignavibacteriaceae bacterium]|nr:BamA/TamA family outer membrane protein [Ignavibacteriaceae bacterium]